MDFTMESDIPSNWEETLVGLLVSSGLRGLIKVEETTFLFWLVLGQLPMFARVLRGNRFLLLR